MNSTKIVVALAALGMLGAGAIGASAAIPSAEEAPVANLQGGILSELTGVAGDAGDVQAAIANATRGIPLDVVVEAVCPLLGANLADIYGDDSASIAQARATLARPEVREGVAETCEVARLALASYGATGATRGRAGSLTPIGSIGAPGGGGGSGYTPPNDN